MKTSELTGAALDWAVAKCEGAYAPSVDADIDGTKRINYGGMYPDWSTDWAQGGPIIEREQLSVEPRYNGDEGLVCWVAYGHNLKYDERGEYIEGSDHLQEGPTPLIAAMRCYVASKLGDTIDIPEELK